MGGQLVEVIVLRVTGKLAFPGSIDSIRWPEILRRANRCKLNGSPPTTKQAKKQQRECCCSLMSPRQS